jgi:hypothetical protein
MNFWSDSWACYNKKFVPQGRSSVVEQRPFKPKVVGSIPTAPTKLLLFRHVKLLRFFPAGAVLPVESKGEIPSSPVAIGSAWQSCQLVIFRTARCRQQRLHPNATCLSGWPLPNWRNFQEISQLSSSAKDGVCREFQNACSLQGYFGHAERTDMLLQMNDFLIFIKKN